MLLQLSFFWRAVAGYVVHCRGHCKVPLLAEHGKHAQVVHHARARLQGTIISFITHHFRSSIILDSDSILYPLYHFIYYRNPMYTTFSVVESTPPPTHQSSSSPSFVHFAPSRRQFTSRHHPSSSREASSLVHVHTHLVQLTRGYTRTYDCVTAYRGQRVSGDEFCAPEVSSSRTSKQ